MNFSNLVSQFCNFTSATFCFSKHQPVKEIETVPVDGMNEKFTHFKTNTGLKLVTEKLDNLS
jgi:hypothetical protein